MCICLERKNLAKYTLYPTTLPFNAAHAVFSDVPTFTCVLRDASRSLEMTMWVNFMLEYLRSTILYLMHSCRGRAKFGFIYSFRKKIFKSS